MSLKEIRDSAMAQLDWQPDSSDEFLTRLNGFINRAYQMLFAEAPELFQEDFFLRVLPDVRNMSADIDRVSVFLGFPGNSRVLFRLKVFVPDVQAVWETTGRWDGRWIEITAPTGRIYRRRILEMWEVTSGGTTTQYISIDVPWRNGTDILMEYRIFSEEYHLPARIQTIRDCGIWDKSFSIKQTVVSESTAAAWARLDYRSNVSGPPTQVSKGRPFQMKAPVTPPVASDNVGVSWTGPEVGGEFEICYTICWGREEDETPQGLRVPKWESGPSAGAKADATTTAPDSILIETPILDGGLGFTSLFAAVWNGKSGLYKRIYVRRLSEDGGSGMTYTDHPEIGQHFFLIGECEGEVSDFAWRGQRIDTNVRMAYTKKYASLRFYPHPDKQYDLRLRGTSRPDPMMDDEDSPMLDDSVREALIEATMRLFYESDGKPELAERAEARYEEKKRLALKSAKTIQHGQHKLGVATRMMAAGGWPQLTRNRTLIIED